MAKLYVVGFGSRGHPQESKVDIYMCDTAQDANRYALRENAHGDCSLLRSGSGAVVSFEGKGYTCESFAVEELGTGEFVISCEARVRPGCAVLKNQDKARFIANFAMILSASSAF